MTVLTGCKTTTAEPGIDTSGILKAMIPEFPDLPEWPQLQWQLEDNGRYSLDEADVDKVLDYWENQIPYYLYKIKEYRAVMQIITDRL